MQKGIFGVVFALMATLLSVMTPAEVLATNMSYAERTQIREAIASAEESIAKVAGISSVARDVEYLQAKIAQAKGDLAIGETASVGELVATLTEGAQAMVLRSGVKRKAKTTASAVKSTTAKAATSETATQATAAQTAAEQASKTNSSELLAPNTAGLMVVVKVEGPKTDPELAEICEICEENRVAFVQFYDKIELDEKISR